MSGEFDSRKDSQSTKLKQRPQIFVKLTFTGLYDSKLHGLQLYGHNSLSLKRFKIER